MPEQHGKNTSYAENERKGEKVPLLAEKIDVGIAKELQDELPCFKVSRFQGFKVSRFQGFKVSRFQGFKVSKSSWFRGFGVSTYVSHALKPCNF
jgi:hypothetical protein